VIVIDQGLLGTLSEEARRAVAHHEHGHAARRDALTLLALRLAAALFPIPGAHRLVDAWRQAAERACDAYAAARLGDPGAVAAALIAVERARAAAGARAEPPAALALGAPAGATLEQRVRALLEARHGAPAPRLGNDAIAAGSAALAVATLAALWPGDLFHHAVETILGWLVP
jgi:beta-lactamase regulating signal transducer with metallopeptidase domain